MFAVVFQDANLLSYTVSENITGRAECTDEERVQQQVHKYISHEGIEFFGGEAQKMVIARAIYKNAKIFILDEPTANLDALAEKDIYMRGSDKLHKAKRLYSFLIDWQV